MTNTFRPSKVSVLTIVRTTPEFTANSTIRAFSLFTVMRENEGEAEFSLTHEAFDANAERCDILAQIIEGVPQIGTLVCESPPLSKDYLDHADWNGDIPPADLQRVQRERRELHMVPLQVPEDYLAATARSMGFNIPDLSGPVLERARKAPMRSQALWLAYIRPYISDREHVDLFAAWMAWNAIMEARPIRF